MCDNRTSEFLSYAQKLPGSSSSSSSPFRGGGGVRSFSTSSRMSPSLPSGEESSSSRSSSSSSSSVVKNNPAYAELRSFHKTAGEISRDIAATSALLTELTQLVRTKSIFQDSNNSSGSNNNHSAKINNLVVRIKSSIENLNARLDQASVTIAQQKRKHWGKNSQAGQEASNLVQGLQTEFAQAASGFKQVLQQRTDNMKETDQLQRQVYGNDNSNEDSNNIPTTSLAAPPPVYNNNNNSSLYDTSSNMMNVPTLDLTSGMMRMSTGEATGSSSTSSSALPRPHGIVAPGSGGVDYSHQGGMDHAGGMRHRGGGGTVDGNVPTYSGSYSTYQRSHSAPFNNPALMPLTPLDIQRMEQESNNSQMMQLIPDQEYLRDRADAMETVESNIAELGTIFNKLAVMVTEHREMVQRVEDNVQDADANINMSLQALTDTLTNLRTNRMLALKVFSVLVLFIIFFIVFFA